MISAGFWPGNGGYGRAAFYSYAAPAPSQLSNANIRSPGGFNKLLGEFILDYDAARASSAPAKAVLEFLDDTYKAAAEAAQWDRINLDRTDP